MSKTRSLVYWTVAQGGAVSVIVTENDFLDHILKPSPIKNHRKRLVESRLLKYSIPPADLDSKLNLEAEGLEHWQKPYAFPEPKENAKFQPPYMEFYRKRVISKEDRQKLLKSLKSHPFYQKEARLPNP